MTLQESNKKALANADQALIDAVQRRMVGMVQEIAEAKSNSHPEASNLRTENANLKA